MAIRFSSLICPLLLFSKTTSWTYKLSLQSSFRPQLYFPFFAADDPPVEDLFPPAAPVPVNPFFPGAFSLSTALFFPPSFLHSSSNLLTSAEKSAVSHDPKTACLLRPSWVMRGEEMPNARRARKRGSSRTPQTERTEVILDS